ncbi:MAG: SpoIVB peptidase S55 domain-containing protein [Candidatus Bipolaricaulaceae bacterium]
MRKLIAFILAFIAFGALATETISLKEIKPGMKGFGLTVVQGLEISRFEVEVVDVLDEPGERNDFIVVRVFGEAIQRSGGIAQGMSGSPVYFEDKLAGALSRAATWALDREKPLGLVTPIESMLQLLPELGEEEIPVPEDQNLRALGIERVILAGAPPKEVPSGALVAWPISVPLVASGLSSRALRLLEEGVDLGRLDHPILGLLPPWHRRLPGFSELGFTKILSAPAGQGRESLGFQPGAPVGVALSLGDFTIGALGTVTLVEDEKILAFGHPFLFSGPCRYFLTGAAILDTVAAMDVSYKFGTLTDLRGGVFVDRWPGIAGRTDRRPLPIEARFTVAGEATGKFQVQLVDEPRLSPLLFYVAGVEAVDATLNRIGPGTARVKYTINGRGLPRPFTRENVVLSTSDLAVYIPWEAALVLDVLAYNEFRDPLLTAVELEAEVSKGFSAVEILDLRTDRSSYQPGEAIQFTVEVRTWRGETRTLEGAIRVPRDLDTPYVELRAYGGPRLREKGEPAPTLKGLEDLLDYIEGIPTYDTLTVELFAVDPISQLMGEAWLYGVDSVSQRFPGSVVYGEVSLILPIGG